MADYTPVYTPGTAMTCTASATVTGGQLVAVSGDGTVGPAAADSLKVVGVAAYDAAANGRVTVWPRGQVHEVTATGAVTAGDILVAATAGTVKTLAVVTTPTAADVNGARAMLGIALTTAADAAAVRYVAL
ncbi:capsid cement protein [Actinomadura sp. GTD37]|uniref:capsid cement protein n=1 Tax=Actinomadura sp. GTD37 TaxID=1778030 RepID=UPI0035C1BD25